MTELDDLIVTTTVTISLTGLNVTKLFRFETEHESEYNDNREAEDRKLENALKWPQLEVISSLDDAISPSDSKNSSNGHNVENQIHDKAEQVA
ncbi:hypothetical protein PsorP6_001179 [Peronosclerospora sorghi]|uniref:Uncharacterized protein n=1 Tax=Peronosclerospora sorghi TaxID=230839 RepID=A0ACC0WY89_9STRA|nr:hypothetical protein PsorP6_001179 [Peronosclerospora sorghi]